MSPSKRARLLKSELTHLRVLDKVPPLKHVLIVEDNKESQYLVMRGIERLNCHFLWADDGYEAIESALNSGQLDLLVLDWALPGLNGGEVLTRVERSAEKDPLLVETWNNKKIPYVIYSSTPLEKLKLPKTKIFQFVDYWKKPVTPLYVLEHTQKILYSESA